MPDVIVIGGGVVGLSIAWELAGHGMSVRVLEQGAIGKEASWAGAGMLPPGCMAGARTFDARLRAAAYELWPDWAQSLTSTTGIDTGFRRCGAAQIRFGDHAECESELANEILTLRKEGVIVESNDVSEIRRKIPALAEEISAAYYLPDFCQVRNPHLLNALQVGCALRNVELISGVPVHRIELSKNRIGAVHTGTETHQATEYVIATGAWTDALLSQIQISLPIEPLKGQIVLLRKLPLPFRSVIEQGLQYLVPRDDGRILVGSTEERVGFDKRSTAQAVSDLIAFAHRVAPCLKDATIEKSWAGLRPFSKAGRPHIGRLPRFVNASIAAGHARYGLHWSPITAVLMRQVLLNQPVQLPREVLVVEQ